MTRLLAELGRPAPSEEQLPALRRTYAQHVGRHDTGSMLALLDGTPVGFISLEFRHPFFTTAPQAWIPDLIVTESARGRDIGRRCWTRRSPRRSAAARTRRRSSAATTAGGASAVRCGRHGGRGSFFTLESLSRSPCADRYGICMDGFRVRQTVARIAVRGSSEVTMSIIAWIVVGAIAGFIASRVVPGDEGLRCPRRPYRRHRRRHRRRLPVRGPDQHGLDDRHQHPHDHRGHCRRDHRRLCLEHDQQPGGTRAV